MSGLKASLLENRGIIRVHGEEARSFLQALITNNVEQASETTAVYAALLTPQGKYLFDFLIVEKDGALMLDCDRGRIADLVKRLSFYKLRAKVLIENISDTVGVAALWGGETDLTDSFLDPRLKELGVRILLPRTDLQEKLAHSGAEMMDEDAYLRHRLSLGVGEAADFEPDRSFPLELNFDELNAIDFKKGCFIGQEVTSRVKRRGSVRKRLVPCHVEGAMPASGTAVMANDREVGTIFSGDAASSIALALLRLDLIKGASLLAHGSILVPQPPFWLAQMIMEAEHGSDE
jgi:folate-binding protein YgfZ